ncbi:MAG: hypothetical protein Q4E13_09125 [Clostridia bacterium]|nr:hypothetical protein [Clostridia bacterium]
MNILNILLMLLGVALISGTCCAVVFRLPAREKDSPEDGFSPRCELESTVGNNGCCPDACAGCIYLRRE